MHLDKILISNENTVSAQNQTADCPTQTSRRPYQAPQLKHLFDIQPQTGTTYPVAENTGGMISSAS